MNISETINLIAHANEFPITLGDFSDNPGIGGMGDATFLLKALFDAKITDVAVATIFDPNIVKACNQLTIGKKIHLSIGGKFGITSGKPISNSWNLKKKILALTQKFDGCELVLGPSVVLEANGIEVIVNSIRSQVYSPDVFYNAGIDPTQKKILVVKSSEHFSENFRKISKKIIKVVSPGVGNMNFSEIPYKKLRRPMWPIVPNPINETN